MQKIQSQKPSRWHENLGLGTIDKIDGGKIAIAFNQAMRRVVADIKDRPGEESARKVTLRVNLKPQLDKDTGVLDLVDVQFEITDTIPKRQSEMYPMIESGDTGVAFQPKYPFAPRAETLFDTEGEASSEVA